MSYNYGLLIDGKDVEVGDILHDHDYAAVCSMDTSGSVVTAVVRYVNGETGRAAWGTRALMMVTRQEGACDRCDAPYTLGSDDHCGQCGQCLDCCAGCGYDYGVCSRCGFPCSLGADDHYEAERCRDCREGK